MSATLKMMIPFNRTVTPQEVAALFCELDNNEQAEFFNAVAEEVDSWSRQFCFQLQEVISSCKLTAGGIQIMREIGEYGESAAPCSHSWAASYDAEDNVDGFDCQKCGAHKSHTPASLKAWLAEGR